MTHIYFYVEAYYAKKYKLLEALSDYYIEMYVGGGYWEQHPELAYHVMQLTEPRSAEDAFYSEYNLRFVKKFVNQASVCEALLKLFEIREKIDEESHGKVHTKIVCETTD